VAVVSDQDAAAELCRRLQPAVFGALALYCASEELAEELTQETMLRVWTNWASVAEMERPDRWALRVAFNLAKSRWRRRRVERAVSAATGHRVAAEVDLADAIAVRAAVARLPERQRAAVVVRYFADLSVADAALVLRCAEGTVKALTHQAVANLSGMFDDAVTTPEEGHG
jgi:RNA polymerase sigma-70 factor (ECF subfamily)